MKKITGVELIAKEREKQIEKHGFTGGHHANHPEWYSSGQLIEASSLLAQENIKGNVWCPKNWDRTWFFDLCRRTHRERLIIAGALIAAELDRLNAICSIRIEERGDK